MPALSRLSALARLGASSLEHRRASGLILYLTALAVMPTLAAAVGSAYDRPWVLAGAMLLELATVLAIGCWGAGDRVWYAVSVAAPAGIATMALSMSQNADVQLQFLMLTAVWSAIYLPSRVVAVALATTTVAAFAPFLVTFAVPGAAEDAEFHEALVLGALLAAIGLLAHTVSRALRDTAADLAVESAHITRVADALGAHLYAGERTADDVYVPSFIGPGLGVLSGGELPDGTEEALQVYRDRIHPEDRPRWDAAFKRQSLEQHAGGEMVVEHRVVGLDGVTRWVRTRTLVHRTDDGRILMEGVANDVTEQLRLRQEAQLVAAELQDSERRFRVMIEHLPTGAIYRDGDDLYLNPAASQITGIEAAGPIAVGEWFSSLHGASGDEVRATYEADRAAGFPVVREVPIRRTDGAHRVVEFSAYRWEAGDVWILHDVTDRVEAERARTAATRELRRLATTDPLTGLANRRRAAERIGRALARDGGALVMLDIDHFKRVNDAYGHAAGDAVLAQLASRLRRASRRGDVVARWGGEEFCLYIAGCTDELSLAVAGERLRTAISGQAYELPDGSSVQVRASLGGTVGAQGSTVDAMVEAADRALYLAKRNGRDQLRLASEAAEIGTAPEDTDTARLAQALALATSIREGVPELHCQQVSDLAGAIAEELGLPAATVRRCRLGGWLHDIGKIAIPDRIVAKPGPLDDDEWEVMRSHAAIGEALASRIPGLDEVRAAIRHHHERWDGRGYPDGLAGERIPVEARIVAAADAYSAITSDRIYRRSSEQDAAFAELHRSAGGHLDPGIVSALVTVLDRPRGHRAA